MSVSACLHFSTGSPEQAQAEVPLWGEKRTRRYDASELTVGCVVATATRGYL